MKSGEMKNEMTLYAHKWKVCLEQNISIGTIRNVLCQTHLLFITMCGLCSHLLTQDEANQLECVIGYATSLYLVIATGSATVAYVIRQISVCDRTTED